MIISILFFVFFLIFFLYVPILAFMTRIDLELSDDLCIQSFLSLALGIVLFVLCGIFIRLAGLSFSWLWLYALFSFIWIVFKRKSVGKMFLHLQVNVRKRIYFLSFGMILITVITQNIVMFRGGWKTNEGMIFPSLDDNMWNISFVVELTKNFPPFHPAMAGEYLKNNHYFYQFFLAEIHEIIHIDIFDLYFRFGPIIVSFLFGAGIYSLASLFTGNKYLHALIVFLGVFSGSASYVTPLFLGSGFDWRGNTFLSDQPFDQIINPYSVLGFSFFLFSAYSLYQLFQKEEKKRIHWSIIFSIFAGSLYGFKSFAGIIVVISFSFLTFFYLLQRRFYIFVPFFFTLLIFIFVFFLITEPGNVSLNWTPGWLLTEMMVEKDKLNLPQFAQIESFYQLSKNMAGLLKIKCIELVIYTLGNFGVRILGVIYIPVLLFLFRKSARNLSLVLFLFFSLCIAFFIPLLFNLGGNAHNIVQFTPYALLIAAIFTGVMLTDLSEYFLIRRKGLIIVCLVVSVIFLSSIVNIKNILSKLESPQNIILSDEWTSLQYVKNHSKASETILIDPRQYTVNPIYIAAISERRLYIATAGDSIQTGRNPYSRLTMTYQFFDGISQTEQENFLKTNKISYIYLLNPNAYSFSDKKMPKYVSLAFQNKKNTIYKVTFDN